MSGFSLAGFGCFFREHVERLGSGRFLEVAGGLQVVSDAVAQSRVAFVERGRVLSDRILNLRTAILRIEFAEE